jgi:hypothetical protein
VKIDENDGLLDGIEDDASAEVPVGLIGSILLLELAALLAAALVRCGVL